MRLATHSPTISCESGEVQGVLSRKKKFSKNWKNAKFKVSKLHKQIANIG
jgi:transposase